MKYMFLLYGDESEGPDPTTVDMDELMKPWIEFDAEAKEAGVYHSGAGLAPSSSATLLKKTGDDVITTDGPFAASKEQLGGYYLLECRDLDHAIEWAKKLPVEDGNSIEIRPAPYM